MGRINGKFATPGRGRAIVHLRSLPSLADLCALHCIADVCVVTPMVDGMNLVAATHVACRHANGAFAKVVLSEFAGSATSLSGAINVNPWDVEATARAMRGVLHMSASEARRRHEDMWTSTCSENFTSKYWASTFLQRLAASKRAEELVTKSPDELLRARTIAPHYRRAKRRLIILDVEDVLLHAYEYISLTGTRSGGAAAAGLSTSSSALSVSSSHLSLSSVHSQAAQRISAILDDLCADPANTVMLTSDHSKSAIETWAGARACVLCAEGGTFFRRALSGSRAPLSPTFVADAEPYAPLEEMSSTDDESAFRPTPARFGGASLLTKSSPASALGALGAIDTAPLQPHSQSQSPRAALRPPTPPPAAAEPAPPAAEVAAALHSHGAAAPEWETVHEVLALLPESPLMEVLRYFTERTPGSWIESMEAGVAWHYTSVESEHGTWQAKELVASLLDMCDRFKLAVSRCEATKTVRMRPISCSKARLVKVRRWFRFVARRASSRASFSPPARFAWRSARTHAIAPPSLHRPPSPAPVSGSLPPTPRASSLRRIACSGASTNRRSARSPRAPRQRRHRSPRQKRASQKRSREQAPEERPARRRAQVLSISSSACFRETIQRTGTCSTCSVARGTNLRRRRAGTKASGGPSSPPSPRSARRARTSTATGASSTFASSSTRSATSRCRRSAACRARGVGCCDASQCAAYRGYREKVINTTHNASNTRRRERRQGVHAISDGSRQRCAATS